MMDVVDRMRACKDEHLEAKFEHAVGVVERAFELYRWDHVHRNIKLVAVGYISEMGISFL